MRRTKLYAMVAASFIAGAFLASPELRVYASTIANDVICSGCVGTSDLASNAVTAAKIKDGEVKAADIATDAVGASEIATNAVGAAEIAANAIGASEIAGVSTLVFAECTKTSNNNAPPGTGPIFFCDVAGVGSGDVAIATINGDANGCFAVTKTNVGTNQVTLFVGNTCPVNRVLGTATIAIIVFDTTGVIIP